MTHRKNIYKSKARSKRIADIISLVIIVIMGAAVLLPIWWIFRTSVMSNAEIYKFPPPFLPIKWRFSNYSAALEYFKFWQDMRNTMIIIVPSVIGGSLTATLCGYAFARLRFPGKKFIFSLDRKSVV
jgi:multiple sugar transport system permease protein